MKSENMVRRPVDRRGIVLILALGMLALFTVVAITLASISRTQATAAGNFKRLEQYGSNTLTVRPDEVNDLFRYALNQLVYDTRNRQSAIRGHSLLRDMYGSPTTYSMTYGTGGGIQSLASIGNNNGTGDGAELRLKRSDLLKLLNITSNNDPRLMALDYQKVYNGTGVFPPRKIDFTTTAAYGGLDIVPATGITAGTFIDNTTGVQKSGLNLTNSEIAAQLAFMNVPGRLMPNAPAIYPSMTDNAKWQAIFANPFGTPPAGTAYWWPLFPINYTEFDAFSPNGSAITRLATGAPIDPERFTYVVNGGAGTYPQGDHWFGADEDYDYPDVNNMFLAMERADGKMLIPSFHRPGIIAQVADGVNTLTGYGASGAFIGKLPWQPYSTNPPADFHGLILRPRAADRDAKTLGIASPRAGRFREMADSYVHLPSGTVGLGQDGLPDDLDGSGFIGDHPTELDVDTDGDGQNDSVWVDLGAPVIQVGDSAVKPLFAFKVIGMDGKINLNVAGNLYKAPTPENNNKAYNWGPAYNSATEQQFNYTLLHKSNLGASPTEVNPQYGFILGDNPGILPSYLPTSVRPPNPVWGLPVGTASIYDPYQRLLEGFANLYTGDQAPGRWTGRADSITGQIMNLPGIGGSDDNGNLTNPSTAVLPGLSKEESFDRTVNPSPILTRNFDYSEGDGGDPIGTIGTVPAGTPAIQNRNNPVDFYGLGTRYSPFSHVVQSYESTSLQMNPKLGVIIPGAMGVGTRTDASIVPFYLNYAGIAGGALGASIKALDDGKAPASASFKLELLQKGLGVERLLANEPTETNVYYSNDDSLFGAADVAALLRANDFDGSTNQSRIESLLPDQLGKRAVEISALATNPTPNYFTSEGYGRRRMRNLFTHESWDLIRYSAPPTFHSSGSVNGKGKGLFLGPAVVGSTGEMLDISGNSTYLGTDPVASYVARSHSGEGGPNFISQLLNYKLPMNGTAATPIASAGSTYAEARDVYEQLALAKTIDGKDFLIPYEVQMGRRFDLNRPLMAYTTGNAATVDLERESLAQQIYVLLALSSGSCGVDPTGKFMTPQARLAQARTIAQIAVNIVDYMDPDNVMTMMRFDPDLSDGWDNTASPTLSLTDDSGSASISPTSAEYKSITRVIGFELPDLVVNESVSIFADNKEPDPANPSENIRFEYMFTWIELFNPWPETIDPADASKAGGVLLAQPSGESIYLVQLNRLNESTPNGTDSPPLAPIGVVDGTTLAPQFIRFNAPNGTNESSLTPTNSPIDGPSTVSVDGAPASSPVVVHGRNSATSRPGYFVIGPASTLLTSVPGVTFPTIAGSGTPDYSASACILRKQTKDPNSSIAPRVDIRLYRKRNPLVNHDPELNPYVVVDSLSQPFSGTEVIRKYKKREYYPPGGPAPTVDLADQNFVKKGMGVYFVKNTVVADSERPGWAATAPTVSGGFESAQRRQPWHGFNRDWTPYPTGATHPLNGKVLGNPDQNIEGYFLGLPSLIDPRKYSSSSISGYVTNDDANGMRQNGFGPATVSLGTVNNNALKRWASFPFLNRQLATPLELLSVRMYGSHLWFLPTSPAVNEWRLRFTDDFEFFPHAWRPESYPNGSSSTNAVYERLWRSRLVPWYQDGRVTHPTFSALSGVADLLNPSAMVSGGDPTQAQLPLPHLYRFFELVECRSRMNNGVPANQQWVNITPPWPTELTTALPSPNPGRGSLTPTVPVPSTVSATQRAERAPGKINLNLITEEEVYRALLDSVETAYFDVLTDLPANQGAYEQNKNYAFSISTSFWPVNYWDSLFTPLGKAPLGDQSSGKALDVVDALGRLVAWSTLTLNNTTSPTVITPPLAGSAGAPVLSTGGFDIRANQLFGGTVVAQTTSFSQLTTNASNLARLSPTNVFVMGSPNRQFPGIVDGAYNPSAFFDPNLVLYPGTNPDRQVHSEMYRAFLLSRSGPDGIHGTADDKPFRSYASDDVSDTILRVRNSATNGLVKEGSLTSDGTSLTGVGGSTVEALSVVAKSFVDGSNDLVSMTTTGMSFYVGDYIARLGGQRTPGLFDPIPDPYSDYYVPIGGGGKNASIPHLLPIGADPADPEFQERLPSYTATYPGSPEKLPVDYWVLEERRNELLAKISGNVTTRSHVFAVWMAVGFFRVEPGTEGLKVPLLGAEVGSESGKAFRHRAFFIIDRSQAKSYDPEDIDANFDFDIMRQKKLLEYYKIIE